MNKFEKDWGWAIFYFNVAFFGAILLGNILANYSINSLIIAFGIVCGIDGGLIAYIRSIK